ncbi:hypothetical protein GCM10010400_69860 [Streptomyces aculeolatus]|uniref:hypothetical protein n=1 Tax=Streptomyces aculeolatus TaxID=270689 RepID=UPI001CED40A4|nr:hypothetical protein [Streptomyces aculeolatus]
MTDRPTASTITDDELDALHERVLYAEAAVRRASALATRWDFTPDRKRAAVELRNELRRRPADTGPDGFAVFDAYAKRIAAIAERPVLRQSPQTAAASPRPDAPGTAPGARERAERTEVDSSYPERENGPQAGAQSLDPKTCTARYVNYHMQWACDRPTGHPGGHSSGDRGSGAYQAWTDQAAGASPAHTGHGSPCEDSPDGTCAAPAPPAGTLRGAIASAIAKFIDDHPAGWTHSDLAGYLTDALEVGRAVLLAHAEAELRRVSALHADTERRLKNELTTAIDQREQIEAAVQRTQALADDWARTAQDPNACIDMDQAADAVRTALNLKETEPMLTCTATITGPHIPGDDTLHCIRTAGHAGNHTGPDTDHGQTLWTDQHAGTTPHTDTPKEN